MNTSDPIPAASSPGSSTSGRMAPPRPVASMIRTAPITGEPKIVETAAKLPAAAIRPSACSGASFFRSRMARIPRPIPSAISGASGPRTRPSPRVAVAASSTPGRSIGLVGPPPVLSPSAGTWPPCPGSRWIANAVTRPASASQGSGHHAGHAVVAEAVGQLLVDPDLELVHELEEAPRGSGDEQADQRGRQRAGRGTRGCGSGRSGSDGRRARGRHRESLDKRSPDDRLKPVASPYSTVTVFARFRGWSTLSPRSRAIRYASSCNGTTASTACRNAGDPGM